MLAAAQLVFILLTAWSAYFDHEVLRVLTGFEHGADALRVVVVAHGILLCGGDTVEACKISQLGMLMNIAASEIAAHQLASYHHPAVADVPLLERPGRITKSLVLNAQKHEYTAIVAVGLLREVCNPLELFPNTVVISEVISESLWDRASSTLHGIVHQNSPGFNL